jgi:hypothetical protein
LEIKAHPPTLTRTAGRSPQAADILLLSEADVDTVHRTVSSGDRPPYIRQINYDGSSQTRGYLLWDDDYHQDYEKGRAHILLKPRISRAGKSMVEVMIAYPMSVDDLAKLATSDRKLLRAPSTSRGRGEDVEPSWLKQQIDELEPRFESYSKRCNLRDENAMTLARSQGWLDYSGLSTNFKADKAWAGFLSIGLQRMPEDEHRADGHGIPLVHIFKNEKYEETMKGGRATRWLVEKFPDHPRKGMATTSDRFTTSATTTQRREPTELPQRQSRWRKLLCGSSP